MPISTSISLLSLNSNAPFRCTFLTLHRLPLCKHTEMSDHKLQDPFNLWLLDYTVTKISNSDNVRNIGFFFLELDSTTDFIKLENMEKYRYNAYVLTKKLHHTNDRIIVLCFI